ncbi:MAG TPA: DUF433 domain-containing protein [Chloroflexota bacterium]|nr:DUF433 domain-containing protein [Chloroflexota bacterium]
MAEIMAFSRDQVRRLTGLSDKQLRYWDDTGFFSPRYAEEDRRGAYARIYSYRDLVGLRAIAEMRKSVSLQELRRVGEWLSRNYNEPWSSLTFYVAGRRVFFDDPDTGELTAGRPAGQRAMRIDMARVERQVDAAVQRLRRRGDEQIGKIIRNRYVVHNVPVLSGTRIPTAAIWDFHEAGYDIAGIMHEYPTLTTGDVEAALAYERNLPSRSERTG